MPFTNHHPCLCQLGPSSLKVGSNDHYSVGEQHTRSVSIGGKKQTKGKMEEGL